MKKNSFAAAVLLMLFLFALANVSAQENTFTDEDLKNLTNNAIEKLKGKSHRQKKFYEIYEEGKPKPILTQRNLREFIPPDRIYFSSERENAEGRKRFEAIYIGEKEYIRVDNGEWQELVRGGEGNGVGNGTSIGDDVRIETTVERKLKKGEMVNKRIADRYEKIITTKVIFPDKTYTSVEREVNWFDANGLLVKYYQEVQDDKLKRTYRTTTDYEYDANIRIEAPVLNGAAKTQ